jgi:phage-related protein
MMAQQSSETKPLFWVASSQDDIREFPAEVRDTMGFALYQAQRGEKHLDAKPLKGFGSASVLEIVEDHTGDTYRAMYTVRFAGVVYVLHAFQKKSKKGIATPKHEINLIHDRLKIAQAHYEEWKHEQEDKQQGRRGKSR